MALYMQFLMQLRACNVVTAWSGGSPLPNIHEDEEAGETFRVPIIRPTPSP